MRTVGPDWLARLATARVAPGPVTGGCEASGRLVSVNVGDADLSDQALLLTDWSQQFPSHSVGDVASGPTGAST